MGPGWSVGSRGWSLRGAAPAGPVDVWIKDCAADTGVVSSTPACPQWYKSTDIWVDNDGDMVIDASVVGVDNQLHAVVRNRESGTATNVTARFYYRDNSTGLVFPDGASFIGEDVVTVPGGGSALANVIWPSLPAPPTSGGALVRRGRARSSRRSGRGVTGDSAGRQQCRNRQPVVHRGTCRGEAVTLDFSAGTGGKSGFGFQRWPRAFRLRVKDGLPAGWKWSLQGEGIGVNKPFRLRLGEQRPVKLEVTVPTDAGPHTGGELDVRQVDVATGRVVGGVAFRLYEDHRPAKSVPRIDVSLVDHSPCLNVAAGPSRS